MIDAGKPKPRKSVIDMAPYHPPSGGRAGRMRLDFNENTVGASPKVIEFLKQALTAERLSIYPEYAQVKQSLASFFDVKAGELLLTNGTDEAIQVLINTYVDAGHEVLIAKPSYAMYRFYSELAGAAVKEIEYQPPACDFPLLECLEAIGPATRAVLISNPNNPTGSVIDLASVELILNKAAHAVVLIDEAYFEFSGITALGLLAKYSNLFVSRTFSKVYGMAAMRVGCLFSNAENVAAMQKAQSPYSVNTLAALAAEAAVQDTAYVEAYIGEALAARAMLEAGLDALGIARAKSAANFVLGYFGSRAIEVRDALKDDGILVRDRSYEIPGGVRITVGTKEQARRVLTQLESLWQKT